jgi:hypothetical protein
MLRFTATLMIALLADQHEEAGGGHLLERIDSFMDR